jgi:hypothetical protein
MNIKHLWEFEKNKPNLLQVDGPAKDYSIFKVEKSTVI